MKLEKNHPRKKGFGLYPKLEILGNQNPNFLDSGSGHNLGLSSLEGVLLCKYSLILLLNYTFFILEGVFSFIFYFKVKPIK